MTSSWSSCWLAWGMEIIALKWKWQKSRDLVSHSNTVHSISISGFRSGVEYSKNPPYRIIRRYKILLPSVWSPDKYCRKFIPAALQPSSDVIIGNRHRISQFALRWKLLCVLVYWESIEWNWWNAMKTEKLKWKQMKTTKTQDEWRLTQIKLQCETT